MRVLIAEKLSPHKYKTPEGYLICQDAILARTGKQTYLNREVYGDSIDNPDKEIEIDRPEAEVFSDKTLASFENKPVTIEHPDEDVNIDNHNFYSVGFVRDIKRGIDNGKPVMVGTLVVTNPDAVADIENGKLLELSCGYDCDIVDNAQTNIRGNHVALCEHGRAGNARIIDSVKDGKRLPVDVRKDLQKFLNHKSTFIHNKDYDIAEFVKEFERIAKLWAEFPLKIVRESIKGWFKTGDGMMRKDYTFSIEGYDDRFIVSLYAKPDTYETTELNAYFTDSVKDRQSSRLDDAGAQVMTSSEHNNDGKNFYGYMAVEHPRLGDFYVSFKIKGSRKEVQLDGTGWNFIKSKGYTSEQKNWIIRHKRELEQVRSSATITDTPLADSCKDSIKDAKFEICYIDNGDVCITIEAKDENEARQKFRRRYGMYYIEHIRKIKDAAKDMIDCDTNDESPVYAVKAKYENVVLEWYARANSEREAFEKVKSQPGHRFDTFVSAKIVKERPGMHIIDSQVKDDEKTILFELLTKYGFKILRQGKTWSGRTHIEFTGDFFDEDDKLRVFSEAKKKIDRLDSEAERAGLRMTFNIGLGKDRVVGSIDSEPMHDSTYSEVTNELKSELKDENLFAQKALKAIKVIKTIK